MAPKNLRQWLISLEVALLLAFFFHQTFILNCAEAQVARVYHAVAAIPLPPNIHAPHNLIPRFKIPRGNLSFYQNPQWEILYYLKYGELPYLSAEAKKSNRARLMHKLQKIKFILEKNSSAFKEYGQGLPEQASSGEIVMPMPPLMPDGSEDVKEPNIHYPHEDLPEGLDPEGLFTQNPGQASFLPSYEEALLDDFVGKLGLSADPDSGQNHLDDKLLQSILGRGGHKFPTIPTDSSDDNKANDGDKSTPGAKRMSPSTSWRLSSRRNSVPPDQNDSAPGSGDNSNTQDPRSDYYDENPLKALRIILQNDPNPNWFRSIIEGKLSQQKQQKNYQQSGSPSLSLGSGVKSLRSGGGSRGSGNTVGGGDTSRDTGRKFQTQGW